MNVLASIGSSFFIMLEKVGNITTFILRILHGIITPPFHFRILGRQLLEIGYNSLPLIAMTALFTGAVLALQSYIGFSRFNAENSIAAIVAISITRELGPVLGSLMLAARVGSSIAAEVGTMRVTDQISALTTLNINPFRYLMVPRVLACTTTLVLLVAVTDVIGIYGGYVIGIYKLGFNPGSYLYTTSKFLLVNDIMSGLIKAAVFGFIIGISGCYHGYHCQNGARGVGVATTTSVVSSCIFILICNYLATSLFFS